MNVIALPPDVKLAEGPRTQVFVARGGPALDDWNALDAAEQTRLEQRFIALCTAEDMLDDRKIRRIKGGPPGIYEIKTKRPPLRAFAFRGGRWWVTHIERKPKPSRLLEEAEKADKIRDEHNRRTEAQ